MWYHDFWVLIITTQSYMCELLLWGNTLHFYDYCGVGDPSVTPNPHLNIRATSSWIKSKLELIRMLLYYVPQCQVYYLLHGVLEWLKISRNKHWNIPYSWEVAHLGRGHEILDKTFYCDLFYYDALCYHINLPN